ncbi:NADH-quinone oxidoreductase subunit NuoK [Buchnera aphidicola (Melanaphis sacchari)]|uniref:NADH-quinone oxidoreductase subunit K n=1 Tax=Buchnera aphidicola (Melanaphis sacchari) TaxID=2173854 RepID=A0A2U8DFW5_9GAMM|nr:NADH-quinone oxidoreductase subunit NuoK [Buchnera aphidicola]AWH90603.1 NADH-quinone oxidoreductase subunit NuoK [Buchnera aphidicola (Melanaphis sacchari)]
MISLFFGLFVSLVIFILGLISLVMRRNILFMLISLEIMINAASLSLVIVGSYWQQIDGQVMYVLAITTAAAEASIALALLLQLYKRKKTLNINNLSEISG